MMAECLSKSFCDNKMSICSAYDTDDEDDYEQFCEHFTFSNTSSCCICNGFYGPSFGEPLCGCCHAFLYPAVEEKREYHSDNDEDSGNDEPPYNPIASTSTNRNEESVAPVGDDFPAAEKPRQPNNRLDNDKMFPDNCPNPDPPRNLRQYLNALTDPRDELCFAGNPVGTPSTSSPSTANRKPLNLGERARPNDRAGNPADICDLPVEVLLSVFSYLDDLSLCNAGQVCKQWRKILEVHTPEAMWERYTKQRWPLFRPVTPVTNWFKIYTLLMESCFCRTCLIQMTLKLSYQGGARVNHFRSTRLRGDFRTLDVDPTEGITAVPLDNQLLCWQASILGPVGSPYEGGKFFIHIMIPFSYPMDPPVVRFLTKIVHPNVSRHGDVGIDIIQHNWSLAITISKLLLSVQSLLTDPFTEVCMEPELGRMYENDRPKFEALARRWTWKYAMTEVL